MMEHPASATLSRPTVHFMHIGKTGGSALRHALKQALDATPGSMPQLKLHGHQTRLADIPPGDKVFFFLRDPVLRAVSGFYSRRRRGLPRYRVEWTEGEARAFNRFDTPNELGLALISTDPALRAQAVDAMRSIMHVKDSLWYWLGSPRALWDRRADVLFIGTQDHLDSDVQVLSGLLGMPITLPGDDVLAHRHPQGDHAPLEPQAALALQQWYEGDYLAIEVCIRLARRQGFGGSLAQWVPQHAPAAGVITAGTQAPQR